MKSTIFLLLGGLAVAGASVAGQTPASADQPTASAASSKIAIDKNGKRRALTSEESAALDAQAKASRAQGLRATQRQTVGGRATGLEGFPATDAEAASFSRTVDGMTIGKPTQEMLSSLTVTRNADGTLTYSEGDHDVSPSAPVEADK